MHVRHKLLLFHRVVLFLLLPAYLPTPVVYMFCYVLYLWIVRGFRLPRFTYHYHLISGCVTVHTFYCNTTYTLLLFTVPTTTTITTIYTTCLFSLPTILFTPMRIYTVLLTATALPFTFTPATGVTTVVAAPHCAHHLPAIRYSGLLNAAFFGTHYSATPTPDAVSPFLRHHAATTACLISTCVPDFTYTFYRSVYTGTFTACAFMAYHHIPIHLLLPRAAPACYCWCMHTHVHTWEVWEQLYLACTCLLPGLHVLFLILPACRTPVQFYYHYTCHHTFTSLHTPHLPASSTAGHTHHHHPPTCPCFLPLVGF